VKLILGTLYRFADEGIMINPMLLNCGRYSALPDIFSINLNAGGEQP